MSTSSQAISVVWTIEVFFWLQIRWKWCSTSSMLIETRTTGTPIYP